MYGVIALIVFVALALVDLLATATWPTATVAKAEAYAARHGREQHGGH